MRRTSDFQEISTWVSPLERILAVARLETLSVARFETIMYEHVGLGLLDLTFVDCGKPATIPAIAIDTAALAQRDGSTFLWPEHIAAGIPESVLEQIEGEVTPWLRRLVRGRVVSGESIRRYASSQAFDEARERGDLGAAPYQIALPGVAPFVYARRFSRGRLLELRCMHAARGSAVLRGSARAVSARDERAALDWFGIESQKFTVPPEIEIVERVEDAGQSPTVVARISPTIPRAPWRRIPISQPVPMEFPFTFDEADAPAVGWFAVRNTETDIRPRRDSPRTTFTSESSGRIAILVRPDTHVAEDSDTDEATELGFRLRSIGIDVEIVTTLDAIQNVAPDLIHVFAAFGDDSRPNIADRLSSVGIPYVVSLEPLGGYTEWEECSLPYIFNIADTVRRKTYELAYQERLLTLGESDASIEPSPAWQNRHDSELRTLLRGAHAVFTSEDPTTLRERFTIDAKTLIAYPGTFIAPEPNEADVSALVPSEPFALVHAPLLKKNHQLSIVNALRDRVPLVLAGPISDVIYAGRIQRAATGGIYVVADPSPEVIAALYRRAALIVDPSLRPSGLSRVLRGMMCGALPIFPESSPLRRILSPESPSYNPRSTESIRQAFVDALMDRTRSDRTTTLARRIAPLADTEIAFRNVLNAYAQIG